MEINVTAVIPAGLGPAASPGVVGAHPVSTPSGQTINVLGPGEEAFYTAHATLYQRQNAFTDASDLQDLDRLIFLEMLAYRSSAWLAQGMDYDGMDLSDSQKATCQRTLKETNELISKVKNDLGLTRAAREKAQYENVGTYVTELKQRAREFGIHRETQVGKMLALGKQLFSIVGAFERSDEQERKKIGFATEAEVMAWVREVMQPEFDRLDEHFIAHHQKYWTKV